VSSRFRTLDFLSWVRNDECVDDVKKLKEVASQSLRANLVTHDSGTFLRAGAHQFASLWTRDFAYAVPGLMATGHQKVAEHHLTTLLNCAKDSDGLIPRILERGHSKFTVLKWTLLRPFQLQPSESTQWGSAKLKPEFYGEHGTRALDSGLLVLLACFTIGLPAKQTTKDSSFWTTNEESIKRVFGYYQAQTAGFKKLLVQGAFEDWQDSAWREGVNSYVNILLLWVLFKAKSIGWVTAETAANMQALFEIHFARTEGLIPLEQAGAQASLETQLHAIEMGLEFPEWRAKTESLWRDLKNSHLWRQGLGLPVDPPYRPDQISFLTKAVGLRHYHDGFRWTWLIAEVGRVALLMNDFTVAETCLRELLQSRDQGAITEILDLREPKAVRTWAYRSEAPFSWGAGRTVMFCDAWLGLKSSPTSKT
jgi:glycogen debranching enzyme